MLSGRDGMSLATRCVRGRAVAPASSGCRRSLRQGSDETPSIVQTIVNRAVRKDFDEMAIRHTALQAIVTDAKLDDPPFIAELAGDDGSSSWQLPQRGGANACGTRHLLFVRRRNLAAQSMRTPSRKPTVRSFRGVL